MSAISVIGAKGQAYCVPESDILSKTAAQWFLHVPEAAPLWSNYLLKVTSLDEPRQYPLTRYELNIFALDPANKPVPDKPATWKGLVPLNIIMRFRTLNDDKARELAKALSAMCVEGVLTPEPQTRADMAIWEREVERVMGAKSYRHGEAFCVMTYRCKACGHEEKVWNSRDGVTPFIMGCVECGGESQHVDWKDDVREPEHIPQRGEYVWVDMPESLKIPIARRRIENLKGTKHEVAGSERERLLQQTVANFQPGEPFLVQL